jgi:hypothetical protein
MRAVVKVLCGVALVSAAAVGGCEVVSGIGGYEIRTGATTTRAATTTTTTGAGGGAGAGGEGGAGGESGGDCFDLIKNGGETDVDCGGPCLDLDDFKPCGGGKACAEDLDCAEGHFCAANVCCLVDTGACGSMCEACIAALTGADAGACAPIVVGRTDENPKHNDTCMDGYVCDGALGCVPR